MISNCRLCGSQNLKLYYTQGNQGQYKFYKCRQCKLVNYDQSTGINQQKYAQVYIDPDDENHSVNLNQIDTYRFIKKQFNKSLSMLEIGCGNGKLLSLAMNDCWSVKGLELSEFLANSIRNRLKIDVEIANFLDYENSPKEVFDLIVLRHVLEHISDPALALIKINSLLINNGSAVLEFPDIEGLDLKLRRFLAKIGVYKKIYPPAYLPGHYNEFCRESFEFLLAMTGFKLEMWAKYSSNPILNRLYNFLNLGNKARVLIRKI